MTVKLRSMCSKLWCKDAECIWLIQDRVGFCEHCNETVGCTKKGISSWSAWFWRGYRYRNVGNYQPWVQKSEDLKGIFLRAEQLQAYKCLSITDEGNAPIGSLEKDGLRNRYQVPRNIDTFPVDYMPRHSKTLILEFSIDVYTKFHIHTLNLSILPYSMGVQTFYGKGPHRYFETVHVLFAPRGQIKISVVHEVLCNFYIIYMRLQCGLRAVGWKPIT